LLYNAPILVVDDEPAIVRLLKTVLRKEGYSHIDEAGSAEEALAACARTAYRLIILDVMLPGMSGTEACAQIRRMTDAPVLFLSARSTDLDKLSGFAVGGDDYVTKPFNPLEVAARVHSLLRRSQPSEAAPAVAAGRVYDFGRFQLKEASAELIVEGRPVTCPSLVYQLLLFLCRHPNRIFTKTELYEKVWGAEAFGDDNTVMVHIHRVRERIEADPSKPAHLVNVRGLGYKLVQREDAR